MFTTISRRSLYIAVAMRVSALLRYFIIQWSLFLRFCAFSTVIVIAWLEWKLCCCFGIEGGTSRENLRRLSCRLPAPPSCFLRRLLPLPVVHLWSCSLLMPLQQFFGRCAKIRPHSLAQKHCSQGFASMLRDKSSRLMMWHWWAVEVGIWWAKSGMLWK